jgi:nicotinamide-nucleotide amidase
MENRVLVAIEREAKRVVASLQARQLVLVTAESCTAGLISGALSWVPGVSQWLAGALVVYQVASKIQWLHIPAETFAEHDVVSAPVAVSMVQGALRETPHASVAVSITGHLGPQAPERLDGVAWVGMATRDTQPEVVQMQLDESPLIQLAGELTPVERRHLRQQIAVQQTLVLLGQFLED